MAKMESINVDIRPHIAAVAQPGDTILIGFAHPLTDEDIEAMDANFGPLIRETGVKIGYLDNVTGMVVIKGEQATD